MEKNQKDSTVTYDRLVSLSQKSNPWENDDLINKTYEFINKELVGDKTKILSKDDISNINTLNEKINSIYNINFNKLDSVHNEKQLANMTNFEAMDIFLNQSKKTVFNLQKTPNNITLSVILPLFRGKNIAWVALESLVRQEDINFNWELIVIEEDFESPFGLDEIIKYKDQLKNIGCVTIKYISLKKWIPLSAKWYFLIQESSESSKVIAFCAADMYQSKKRLSKQYDVLMSTNKNWYKIAENLIYDLGLDSHAIFPISEDRNDSCSVSASKDLVKNLPLICLKKHVDSWLYNTLLDSGLDYYYDNESELKYDTINVNGINNLSIGRENRLSKIEPPLKKCCDNLENHIPKDMVKKFKSTIKYVEHHKEEINKSQIKLRIKDQIK